MTRPTKIGPDHPAHKVLEREAVEYLESLGFEVGAAPYHETQQQAFVERLQKTFTVPALRIRGSADRIALHTQKGVVFEWEVKTNDPEEPYRNMSFEALPLVFHIEKCRSLDCLYICRQLNLGLDFGFWVSSLPPIGRIDIPSRPEYIDVKDEIDRLLLSAFGRVYTRRVRPNKLYSGDPYVLIWEDEVKKLPDWRNLAGDILRDISIEDQLELEL